MALEGPFKICFISKTVLKSNDFYERTFLIGERSPKLCPWIANFQVLVSRWTIDFKIFSGISIKPNIAVFQNGMTLDFGAKIEQVISYAQESEDLRSFQFC